MCVPVRAARRVTRRRQVFEQHSSRHSSGPYKVHVMHTHVVAHQTFAMRLLLWLKKLIEEVDGFRTLFGQIVTDVSRWKLPRTVTGNID